MNRKIIALLLSLVMVLCQSTLCFGEELAEASEEVILSAIEIPENSDFEISGDAWDNFTAKKATFTKNGDGSATFVPGGSGSTAGRSECIAAEAAIPFVKYDEVIVSLKYTDVSGHTSKAEKDNGFYVPTIKVEFECVVDGGTSIQALVGKPVTGDSTQVYTTGDYVDVALNISSIEDYKNLTSSKVTIYPMYGFKNGTVDIKSITVKKSEIVEEPDEPGVPEITVEPIVWNFDSDTNGFENQSGRVLTLTNIGGILKCENSTASGSGYMVDKTVNVGFDGEKYNRIEMKVKLENCESTNGSITAAEFYWSGKNKSTGETMGIAQSRSEFVQYLGAKLSNGTYSTADYIIVDAEFAPKNWSDCIINEFRMDPVKNAAGTVYIDYIKLYYKDPASIEPDEPEVPDTPTEPDEPVEDPDKPEDVVIAGEQWLEMNFDSAEELWSPNDKKQVTMTWLDGGYMKFVSTPTVNSQGVSQSGWATKKVAFDGNQYYKMIMRAKIEDYQRTFNGSSAPYFTMYYAGVNAAGNKQNASSSFAMNVNYTAEENDMGLFNGDWVEYEVDLSSLGGWATMQEVNEFRIDFAKNAAGTVYVDYIRFLSLPAIEILTYNEIADSDITKVPTEVKTFEAYVSQPLHTITKNDVRIYEKSDEAVKAEVDLNNVVYSAANKKITVEIAGELLSDTDYVFEIKNTALVNKSQKLYRAIAKEFHTDASSFETKIEAVDNGSAKVIYENTGASARNIVAVATAWNGTKYLGKVIVPVNAVPGTTEIVVDYSGLEGNEIELISWEFVNGKPKAHGKKIVKFAR